MDTRLISVRPSTLAIVVVIKLITAMIITFFSYNAGFGDGVARTYQEIAKCTIQDAHLEKCFIPCSEDLDCLAKNGMKDH